MEDKTSRRIVKALSVLGIFLCVAVCYLAYVEGFFSSQEKIEKLVNSWGILAPVCFVLIQIAQIIVPIVPGGVSLLAGVVLFGGFWGFLYNYIGISLGSFMVFYFAKTFGRPLLPKIFSESTIEKYKKHTGEDSKFSKFMFFAILVPFFPDDFLCYLAGTTAMSWKKFAAIILVGKPLSILVYSVIYSEAWQFVIG